MVKTGKVVNTESIDNFCFVRQMMNVRLSSLNFQMSSGNVWLLIWHKQFFVRLAPSSDECSRLLAASMPQIIWMFENIHHGKFQSLEEISTECVFWGRGGWGQIRDYRDHLSCWAMLRPRASYLN